MELTGNNKRDRLLAGVSLAISGLGAFIGIALIAVVILATVVLDALFGK